MNNLVEEATKMSSAATCKAESVWHSCPWGEKTPLKADEQVWLGQWHRMWKS